MAVQRLDLPSPGRKVPLQDDLKLWRYLSFPQFLRISNGELFFPNLRATSQVNDPLESVHIAEPPDVMSAFAAIHPGMTEVDSGILEELMGSAVPWMANALSKPQLDSQSRTVYLAMSSQRFFAERRAISCWYSGPYESAGMWKTFAPTGVAITVSLRVLELALPDYRDFTVSSVHYVDREATPLPLGSGVKYRDIILRPYLIKGMEFEHEHEIRVTTRCAAGQPGFGVKTRLFDGLSEIFISPYLDLHLAATLKEHIEEIVNSRPNHPPFSKVHYSSINRIQAETEDYSVGLGATLPPAVDSDVLPL
jgi:hypothetical protein